MAQTIKNSFILGTRESMIGFSRMLGRNLNLAARPDPHNPIILSVHGSEKSGKSLISEMVAETVNGLKYVFDIAACLPDHIEKSEYEMQFLDIAYPGLRSIERLCAQDDRIAHALSRRQKQGVTFFHNAPEARPDLYDADIRVCSVDPDRIDTITRLDRDDGLQKVSEAFLEEQGLLEQFHRHAHNHGPEWVRYVSVEIRNPEIFMPELIANARKFSDPAAKVMLRDFV